MATVRMTLAAAGLMVCGLASAEATAAETAVASADAVSPAASAPVKPKAASDAVVSKKAAKDVAAPMASSRATSPTSGRMQVEEPNEAAPMSLARESKAWQKNHSRGLTDAQKKAFRERKENMEGMIAVIKEKRKALRDAKPEERAALARELHSLILEKDPAANSSSSTASATARVTPVAPENPRAADISAAEAMSPGQASKLEDAKKAKAAEAAEYRRKLIEAYQEQQRKKDVNHKKQNE